MDEGLKQKTGPPLSSLIAGDLQPNTVHHKNKKGITGEKRKPPSRDGGGRDRDRYVTDSDDDHLSSAPQTAHCPADTAHLRPVAKKKKKKMNRHDFFFLFKADFPKTVKVTCLTCPPSLAAFACCACTPQSAALRA